MNNLSLVSEGSPFFTLMLLLLLILLLPLLMFLWWRSCARMRGGKSPGSLENLSKEKKKNVSIF